MTTTLEAKGNVRRLVMELDTMHDRIAKTKSVTPADQKRIADIGAEIDANAAVIKYWATPSLLGAGSGSALGYGQDMQTRGLAVNGSGIVGAQGDTGLRVNPFGMGGALMREFVHAARTKQALRIDTKDLNGLESVIPPVLGPTLGRIVEPTRVAALFPVSGTDAPITQYICIDGQSGAATPVAPGALKPTVGLLTSVVTAEAIKEACLIEVTDELLDYLQGAAGMISAEIQRALIECESDQILNGDGTAGNMAGILSLAGLSQVALAGDTVLDTLEKAETALRTGAAYAQADGVVMHPSAWSGLRRLKDSQGRYLFTSDATNDVVPTIFGVPVILTTIIDPGTALVGAFQLGALLLIRTGMTVTVNNQGDQQFSYNKTLWRAELRETLCVTRPAAFCKVTL